MLAALARGLSGKNRKWFSLNDKLYSRRNLEVSWHKVRSNEGACGIDGQTVEKFSAQSHKYLEELHNELKNGTYIPRAVRRVYIPKGKGKSRPLGIPAVKDRIVQTALKHVLEPIFEDTFRACSYGFRPGRGCKDALREVDRLLKEGNLWVVDADIKNYFDEIDHGKLLAMLEEKVSDTKILTLVERYLRQTVMETAEKWTPEKGTPQGSVISPLLANIYLTYLDKRMEDNGFSIVRYADDFVVLCRNEAEARRAYQAIQESLVNLNLELHPEKTHLVDMHCSGGFDFLGYHFEMSKHKPGKINRLVCHKSKTKFRDRIRNLTRRTSGESLECTIAKLNPVLKGWFAYFKHSHKWTFKGEDSWIRMRLRSILRKHNKRSGRAYGSDNGRYPNSYFAERGLFSLHAAYVTARQS